MRRILTIVALLCAFIAPAYAQKTKAALTAEINTNWPDQNTGSITPALLRSTVLDIVNSYFDLNGTTSLSCAAHNWIAALPTLSSITCTQPVIADISGWGTGVASALGVNVGSAGSFVVNGGALGVPSTGILTNLTGLPIASGVSGLGTGVATALSHAANGSAGIIAVTPVRAGDIVYWNGSSFVTLSGNNSGTQVLSENASGVPSWTTAGAGTVTSAVIAAGTGISVSGTCTITNTGTCTVANTGVTSVAGAGMASGTVTTTGNITVTAASKSDQQTGTSAVNGVTPLHQQDHASAAKAWASFGTTGTIAVNYNVTSVTHTGTGVYTVNFTTAFATTNFACMANPLTTAGMSSINTKTTSSVQVITRDNTGTAADLGADMVCFGGQ